MISACSQAAVSKRLCLLAQYEELARRCGNRNMVVLPTQTKGSATDRFHLHHRVTPRLHKCGSQYEHVRSTEVLLVFRRETAENFA